MKKILITFISSVLLFMSLINVTQAGFLPIHGGIYLSIAPICWAKIYTCINWADDWVSHWTKYHYDSNNNMIWVSYDWVCKNSFSYTYCDWQIVYI